MTFEQFEKQLLKNKKFREIAAKSEPKYQLTRSKIAAGIDKRLINSEFNVGCPIQSHKQLFRAILASRNERELAMFFESGDVLALTKTNTAKTFITSPRRP